MEHLLISACLLGLPCRYDSQSKPHPKALELAQEFHLIPYCPECMGGLPTPRPPAEIRGDRVINAEGVDVTAEYRKGAEGALALCRLFHCKRAVLKAKSPSCGYGEIYDGAFQRKLIPGNGVTAALLEENGISILTENEI